MSIPVIMPKIGQSVETCILTGWFKKKGDPVSVGDLLFSFETDKAAMEEEAKAEGILLEVFYETGAEIPVLTNIGIIGQPGEQIEEYRMVSLDASACTTGSGSDQLILQSTGKSEERFIQSGIQQTGRIKISPRAKALAQLNHIDFTTIQGTGPGGRIMVSDIELFISSRVKVSGTNMQRQDSSLSSDNTEYIEKKISNVRKLISEAMHHSIRHSAQLTHHLSADARRLLELRAKVKEQKASGAYPDITLNDMVCYAVISSLKLHPEMNCHFLGNSVREFRKIHLAIAVDTPRGLMVPVVKNAGDMSIEELSVNLRNIAGQCRQGSVNPDLLLPEAASFTISNLGAYGIELFTPILNVPQVGIIGVNTITLRPADIGNGVIAMLPFIGISLTYDHRAVDGGPASRFLQTIKNKIESFAY
jgi:pyruvate dehydrogenase E2 component (dihydrolipoamide acetyltransferase)